MLLMYSVSSRQSFNEIPIFVAQVLRVKDADTSPMVIVGYEHLLLIHFDFCLLYSQLRNKCDLIAGDRGEGREVTTQEGIALAKSINVPFLESRYRN
jgi:GTPase KRas protein